MHETRKTLLRPHTNVEVVYAGGTISSLATPMGYREGGHVVDLVGRLQERYPDFGTGIRLGNVEVAYAGLSENMDSDYWEAIDTRINQALDKNPNAIVLTHGTDSMEQTAKHLQKRYGQQLKEKGVKVVITGANEDLEHPQTDAWDNLHFAFESVQSDEPEGVYVAFHQRLIPADLVVKEPFNGREMNYVSSEDEAYQQALQKQHQQAQEVISRLRESVEPSPTSEPSVLEYEVNVVRPNHQEFLDSLSEQNVRAILLILYHSGTANTEKPDMSVAELVKKLREQKGIVSFGVAENGEPIDLHSYETSVRLREAGVVPLYNIQREVALEKLKLVAIGSGTEIIDQMLDDKVGEIDEALVIKEDIEKLKQLYPIE